MNRLSRLGDTVKERAASTRQAAVAELERRLQWLRPRRRMVFWAAVVTALLIAFAVGGRPSRIWDKYHSNREDLTPIVTLLGAAVAAWVALRQVRIALRQADTAARRHEEQTNADRQRRITESFSKAIEQLGSDKLEVRLGGIYSLERISKESPDDYWTVMENLTAFVRERSRRNETERTSQDFESRVSRRAYFLWREEGGPNGRAEEFGLPASSRTRSANHRRRISKPF